MNSIGKNSSARIIRLGLGRSNLSARVQLMCDIAISIQIEDRKGKTGGKAREAAEDGGQRRGAE